MIPAAPYRRIATEEAWAPPEMLALYRELARSQALDDPGFNGLWGFYLSGSSERVRHVEACMTDLDEQRLRHMDEAGIAVQVLALTSPGVQVMQRADAVAFARESNDRLAAAIARHPTRFAGMAAVAPQDPEAAAREIERATRQLGLRAVVINSHTQGEYLSDPKFWTLFEAAQAQQVPIYLHPNTPPKSMIAPFLEAGLEGAIFGFGVETGLHALRIITAGVFDRFPRLQMVLGHMGEALPFWLHRLEYMHRAAVRSKRYACMPPLRKGIGEVLREHVYFTCSGMSWEPAIRFTQSVIGTDRVMYAMDYPFQHELDEVQRLDAMDLPAPVKHAFFEGNARRCFGLA